MPPPEPVCRCGAPLIRTKPRASRPIMPGRGTHACTMDAPIRLSVDVTTGDIELIRAAYSSRLSSVMGSSPTRLPPRSSRAFMPRNVATFLRMDVETVDARMR